MNRNQRSMARSAYRSLRYSSVAYNAVRKWVKRHINEHPKRGTKEPKP